MKPQEKTLEEDLLGSGAIQFALELGRVKSMPDMPSVFYEAVEKSFIKYAKPAIEQAREEGRKEGYKTVRAVKNRLCRIDDNINSILVSDTKKHMKPLDHVMLCFIGTIIAVVVTFAVCEGWYCADYEVKDITSNLSDFKVVPETEKCPEDYYEEK